MQQHLSARKDARTHTIACSRKKNHTQTQAYVGTREMGKRCIEHTEIAKEGKGMAENKRERENKRREGERKEV